MIKTQSFFGYARTGILKIKEDEMKFPMLIGSGEFNFASGTFSLLGEEGTLKEVNLLNQKVNLYETENFFIMAMDPLFLLRSRKTVKLLTTLKELIGYDKLLYIPGISDPYIIPQLFALGVDVFDEINAKLEEAHGTFYTMFGRTSEKHEYDESNSEFIERMLQHLSTGITNLTLMEMVERWKISAKGIEVMRRIVEEHKDKFELVYPRFTGSILASDLSSMNRPDVLRFNEYVAHEYRQPEGLDTALFIPCSARKPYSSSKSHIALREALGSRMKFIHEIVLTSPLSVVPIELDEAYPPGFYDIPVTGKWYTEEQVAILRTMESFLRNNSYRRIILFLPEDMEFVAEHMKDRARFIKWDKSAEEPFKSLLEFIDEDEVKSPPRRDWEREKLLAMASYQFGSWIGEYLKDMKVNRMFNQFMLSLGNKPYLILNQKAGKLTIHKNAADIFLKSGKFLVEIDDFKPTANIYAMGIKDCSQDIRQEDEIVIHHNGEVRGTGIAKMSASVMKHTSRGIAIKVRN